MKQTDIHASEQVDEEKRKKSSNVYPERLAATIVDPWYLSKSKHQC